MKLHSTITSLFSLLLITASLATFAQTESNKPVVPRHEVAEGEYIYQPRENFETSQAYKYTTEWFTAVQVNVNELGLNIVGDAGNEPSITFDPNDPNKMAIGWRQFDNIGNNFRQAGIGFTTDGGETWTFPGPINPGIFRSDPVLDCDIDGNFYYNSLTVSGEDYLCDVFISDDGGATWDDGTDAQGGDKQWMTIDKTSGIGSGNIYAFWNASFSICDPDFFTRSTDNGYSYEDCVSIPDWPYWGTTVVDANGDLYTCGKNYMGSFTVAKSSNAKDPNQTVDWDFGSNVDLDGEALGFGGYGCPNPSGILGQASISVDSSGGLYHGNVYLLCSVDRYSTSDPLDVMFAKSTNGGLTWSDPIRINDDPTNNAWQWFGTLSVAPNGRIDVVWLDTRNNSSNMSVLYYAFSLDGGDTWSENMPLSEGFNSHVGWPDQDKMGDYFDMFSDETGAHLAWSATFNGEQDVYYGHITPQLTGTNKLKQKSNITLSQNFPNPCKGETTIRYYLSVQSFVSIKILDLTGRVVAELENEVRITGNHQISYNVSDLESGVYYYQLQAGEEIITRKMMVM